MLIRFTQNDYDREIGLMAIGQPPGPEVMMGVSRLVMAADRETAEFAVIVADPWQGKGLGPKLVEGVIAIAREQGVKLLLGDVLAPNQPMLDMVKRLGFSLTRKIESQTFRVEMELQQVSGERSRGGPACPPCYCRIMTLEGRKSNWQNTSLSSWKRNALPAAPAKRSAPRCSSSTKAWGLPR